MATTPIDTLKNPKVLTSTPNKTIDAPANSNNGPSFGSFLADARDSVQASEKTATGMLTGQSKVSMVDAVAQIAEAEVKLTLAKTAIEKGVGAYKEINGLQL